MVSTLQLKIRGWGLDLKKQDSTVFSLQEMHITGQDKLSLKVKE
jgi:hypothetical protein